MIFDKVLQWFRDVQERKRTINEFNENAKMAFQTGEVDILFRADETAGVPEYRHPQSKIWLSGFRIKSDTGRTLTRDEILYMGRVILNDENLTRRLYCLGWDTLYVVDLQGGITAQWAIKDFVRFTYQLSHK